jgi:exodeoxyribonuclease VII large subunit
MQGDEAERSIIEALLEVNKDIDEFDLLVIIRGGGATLDLECFDGYDLASHVAQFPIPVITGIGHERDETLVDIVANTSLKTPTAVAEFLISGCRDFEERLENLYVKIIDHALNAFKENKSHLDHLTRHIKFVTENTIKGHGQKINVLSRNIQNAANGQKRVLETVLAGYVSSIKLNAERYVSQHKKDLFNLSKRIELVDPKIVLKKGYSITRINKKIIKSARQLEPGDIIESEFAEGRTKSRILK